MPREHTSPPSSRCFYTGQQGVCFGPPICRLGVYTYFCLDCYLKTRHQCASTCLRWVMFLICDSKQTVESKVIPKFLSSATVDVRKPGMEKLRWEVLLRVAGKAMRIASDWMVGCMYCQAMSASFMKYCKVFH